MTAMKLEDYPDEYMVVRMKQENTINPGIYLGGRDNRVTVFSDFASAEAAALIAVELEVFPGMDFVEIVTVGQIKAETELEPV